MIALKDKLVSAWRLVKYEELPVDGSPATLPLGDDPTATSSTSRPPRQRLPSSLVIEGDSASASGYHSSNARRLTSDER
jgi:hypothetical protein